MGDAEPAAEPAAAEPEGVVSPRPVPAEEGAVTVTRHVVRDRELRVLEHYGSIMVQAGSCAPLAASPGRARIARIARLS